ncbi:MAG: hypothetical protein ABI675_18585 [Chitinophagaceae bacterium]
MDSKGRNPFTLLRIIYPELRDNAVVSNDKLLFPCFYDVQG